MVKLHACRSLTGGDDEIKIFAPLLQPHSPHHLLFILDYKLYFVFVSHVLYFVFVSHVLYFVFCIVLRLKYLHHYCTLILPLSDPRVLHCQIGVYCVVMQYNVRYCVVTQYIALCSIALKDLRILLGNAIHCPNVSASHS